MKITLEWKFLQHDIEQWTWRLANNRIADIEQRDNAQADNIGSDVSFYKRKVGEACAELKEKLRKSVIYTHDAQNDALETANDKWELLFDIDSRSYIDAESMAAMVHQFVIRKVMLWWAEIHSPNDAKPFADEAESLKAKIEDSVYKKKAPARCSTKNIY